MKRITAVLFLGCSLQLASAQGNYVTHTVKQGESLSAIARQYHTSVGDIMRMNGMNADSKLLFGAKIKIPSAAGAKTAVAAASTPAPTRANAVTHTVTKGETLYSISKQYNITVAQLKAWNNITDDVAKLGEPLIVSAGRSSASPAKEPLAYNSPPAKQRVETSAAGTQATVSGGDNDTYVEVKPNNKAPETKNELPPVQNNTSYVADQISTDYSGEGYFASEFKDKKSKKMKNVSGVSKTFKTASGWADGKYYILADDIEPGTIVKLTADNGNAVYAKVLWNMSDLKENSGVSFRVSNATASALHVSDQSFNLDVSF